MTLYVSTGQGSDLNTCTLAAPCKTFARADSLVPYRVRHTVNFILTRGAYSEPFIIDHLIEPGGALLLNGVPMSLAVTTDGAVPYILPDDAGRPDAAVAGCDAACDAGTWDVGSVTFSGAAPSATYVGPVIFKGTVSAGLLGAGGIISIGPALFNAGASTTTMTAASYISGTSVGQTQVILLLTYNVDAGTFGSCNVTIVSGLVTNGPDGGNNCW
jgi:hypothetical protein